PYPDVDKFTLMSKPKKPTYAEIAFLDTPRLDIRERRDTPRRLGILREANGLVVVLNGFTIGDLPDELKRFREELVFADLEILTNRLSKVQANLRKPKPAKEREADQFEEAVLKRIIAALEAGQSPKDLGLKGQD